MKTIAAFFRYILFGNIYIAACAVMLVVFSSLSFHRVPDTNLLIFIFFSTISSYGIHSIFNSHPISNSERIDWIGGHKKILIATLILSSLLALFFFFYLLHLTYCIIVLAVLTFLYSAPRIYPKTEKKLQLIQVYKAFYLALIWTLVTVILPVYQDIKLINLHFWLFFITQYLFILQVCLLFDFRDKYMLPASLRKSTLKTWSHSQFIFLMKWLMISVIVMIALQIAFEPHNEEVVSMLFTEIIFGLLLIKSINSRSDYYYAVVVDGFLLIPGIVEMFRTLFTG